MKFTRPPIKFIRRPMKIIRRRANGWRPGLYAKRGRMTRIRPRGGSNQGPAGRLGPGLIGFAGRALLEAGFEHATGILGPRDALAGGLLHRVVEGQRRDVGLAA
ncbi:hypothetical protein SAMN04488069_10359 [Hymenobacter psychrophilus]|uniref:Uncharacterized protein n=1 Tax=Hymenobacter psychrophilus TaxID=651662 RepID=A0A1H3ECN2_9BACT|nr:hypothetical protein SAMN04488069_10359 [Hymenobacter psychrophilus]